MLDYKILTSYAVVLTIASDIHLFISLFIF